MTMSIIQKTVWLVVIGYLSGIGWALTLVQDGAPQATIVIAAEANEKVKTAAEELRTYVEKMSGAQLPLVTDEEDPDGALILVGASRLSQAMDVKIPSGLTNTRREEGFLIHCRGDRLVLAGNNEGPYHGTEYAVYEFLNRLGVRWFMPGEFGEIVPRRRTISVPQMKVLQRPDFVIRHWGINIARELEEQERRWRFRNKMNPDNYGFAFPGDQSARRIVRPELLEEQPELFAMNPDGSRNPHLPNLTNPQAVEVAVEIIKNHFRQNPDSNSYAFAPDDGFPRDYSPQTIQVNRGFVTVGGRPGVPGEVSTTEEWISFVNQVTAEVRKEFPDVYIATNGYANRNTPPHGLELDDHLVIMFAAIWSCTLHAYDDPHCWQKVRQAQMLKRWCELCDNVWVYGYNYQMLVSGLTPLPEFTKLRRDLPLMHKWGVIGFIDETRNVWAECGIASRYLRARLEWDAEADVDAILDDFFAHWYGQAAEPMKGFYFALDEAIAKCRLHIHEDRLLAELYTPELMRSLERYLHTAERWAQDERSRLHVRADRLIYEHLQAYVRMWQAYLDGEFRRAAGSAARMLRLREKLHQIDKFYIWPDEQGYHTGVWYWKIGQRRDFFDSLADKISGQDGGLVAMCPTQAQFRLDPHDEGRFAGWYKPQVDTDDWRQITTTRPFYLQGYIDAQGHPYVGNMWYRLEVPVPQSAAGQTVMLYVPMVSTEAWCWVNGQFVGYRPYQEAYMRPAQMECEVTEALRPGEVNTIVFRVHTSLSESQAAAGLYSRPFLYSPQVAPE